jgi:autotransporter-associated beta strand protein
MTSPARPFISFAAMRATLIGSVVVLAVFAGRNQVWAQYDPGQSNLALGGTATSTNTDFGGTPNKGVDGNRDGNFGDGSVFYGNSPSADMQDNNLNTTYFYQVDLGADEYVNRVQFFPRTDAQQAVFGNFNISIYADNGGVPGAVTYSQNFNSNGAHTDMGSYFGDDFSTALPGAAALGGANGRFVRITRLNNQYYLTFAEMEVVGSATPLTHSLNNNIALGKPVTLDPGDSAGFGSTNASGNDGDINGDFSAPNQGTTGNTGKPPVFHTNNHGTTNNVYWQVDLGADKKLSYANLFERMETQTTSEFEIEVFDHNMNLVDTKIVSSSSPQGMTPTFDHAIDLTGDTGEFVRVTVGPDAGDSFLAFSELQVFAAPPSWTGASSTSWADSGNWSGAVPGATSGTTNTDTALFDQNAANSPLVIDVGRNLQNITFDTASVNSLTIGSVTGKPLLLTSAGAIQATSTVVNPQTINAPLVLEGNYTFSSGATSDTATLTFGGGITPGPTTGTTTLTLNGSNTGSNMITGALTDNSSGVLAITKDGLGLWILSGANSYSGPTTVTEGTLRFNASGTPTIAAGATATVASGATLELAGAISALGSAGGNRVHVTNNSSAPGLLITGMHQLVGSIDGIGTTQVNAGSDLTANHIIQSALIIGGAAGSPAIVTIDASDASGNPLATVAPSGMPIGASPIAAGGDLGSSSIGAAIAESPTSFASPALPDSAAVPEPSSLLLLVVGTLAVGQAALRRSRTRNLGNHDPQA